MKGDEGRKEGKGRPRKVEEGRKVKEGRVKEGRSSFTSLLRTLSWLWHLGSCTCRSVSLVVERKEGRKKGRMWNEGRIWKEGGKLKVSMEGW